MICCIFGRNFFPLNNNNNNDNIGLPRTPQNFIIKTGLVTRELVYGDYIANAKI